MKVLRLLWLVPLTALGEDIKPFDRLGKDNVTIRAQHISGGSSTDYSYKTSWGSYVRTVKSFKDIEVTIAAAAKGETSAQVGVLLCHQGRPSPCETGW